MINKSLAVTTTPARFGMPISGHFCGLGMKNRETALVRDYAFAGVAAVPGPDAWSPPI